MSYHSAKDPASGDDHLGQIIAAFLDSGRAHDAAARDQLLKLFPDLANDLEEFFAGHDRMTSLTAPDETVGPPAPDSVAGTASPLPFAVSDDSRSATDGTTHFGDYQLLEEIDRGGMGVVYKARQLSLNRVVALKMILSGHLASQEDVQRFHSEAEAAANLDHPGIVPVYEVGQQGGYHYFSMGLIEGPSLASLVDQGPMPPREAAEIIQKVAEAVAFAHTHGVIHRDLKPANILLSQNPLPQSGSHHADGLAHGWWTPRITDFGLAKRVQVDSDLTTAGQILGTPSYMPPEQARGDVAEVAEAADIYSIGAILYALLTGRPPFHGDHPLDVLIQVIEQDVKSARELNGKIPRDLNTICLKCLAKDPRLRYQSSQALADDLQRFLNGESIEAKPLGPLGRLLRWARSHPALAVTWAALGVFYAMHLVCWWVLELPGEGGAFHWTLTAMVSVWAAGAWAFQRLAVRSGLDVAVLYGWSALDVVLFTGVLTIANGPTSPLIIGYLLLIAGAGLRFRIRLVWCVAILSIVGYVSMVLDARWYRPHLQAEPHTHFYFLLSMVVMALIMHLVLRRVGRLARSGAPPR